VKIDSSNALQILILFTVTGFTRILIVLGFIRSAMGTSTTPPNQVLVGIALFLTLFVMSPTLSAMKKDAWEPLQKHQISMSTAITRGEEPLREFMFRQVQGQDLTLFVGLAHIKTPQTRAQVPTYVLIPAFIMGELKTAFQIGFLIFLPFLIIDLIVSSTLMSVGMMMLPPTFISLPFKILLFVLVDGWDLITHSLIASFH
jgi:flagellar biosynthetic protein FliP